MAEATDQNSNHQQAPKMDMKVEVVKPNLEKIVIVVGSTGTGKSTIINMLYNDSCQKNDLTGPSPIGATTDSVTKGSLWHFNARDLTIYGDTVGLSDPHQSDLQVAMDLKKFIQASRGGIHCIIIVLKYGRISREERINLEIISQIFDERWVNNCIIVATHFEGEINSETGMIDDDAQKNVIEKWVADDEEIKDFISQIKGNVILTDTSLGRHEAVNRPLRQQCLLKLKLFIDSCNDIVGPSPTSWIETLSFVLERWFGLYRITVAKKRMNNIIKYLANAAPGDVKAGECPVCMEDVLYVGMAQTRCNHVFHVECISKAIGERGGPCPICRSPVSLIYTPDYFT